MHALAYAGWAMAMPHGLTSGTDSATAWVRVLYLVCASAVVASVALQPLMGISAKAAGTIAGENVHRNNARRAVSRSRNTGH